MLRRRAADGITVVRPVVHEVENAPHFHFPAVLGQGQIHAAAPAVAASFGNIPQGKQVFLPQIGIMRRFGFAVLRQLRPAHKGGHRLLGAIRVV